MLLITQPKQHEYQRKNPNRKLSGKKKIFILRRSLILNRCRCKMVFQTEMTSISYTSLLCNDYQQKLRSKLKKLVYIYQVQSYNYISHIT